MTEPTIQVPLAQVTKIASFMREGVGECAALGAELNAILPAPNPHAEARELLGRAMCAADRPIAVKRIRNFEDEPAVAVIHAALEKARKVRLSEIKATFQDDAP
jgi:hypothetical protein